MLKLSLRNIFRHRVRTVLTLCAIASGVCALILSGGFVEDIFVQLGEATIHSQLGHAQINKTGFREIGRRNPYEYLIDDSETLVKEIAGAPHVVDVLRRLSFHGLGNNGQADLPILGEGVEPAKESRLGTAISLVAGRELEDDDIYGVMVGKGVSAALKLNPGDSLTLLVTTPDGALNSLEFTVVGIFQTISKDYDNRAVRVPLLTAQELVATEGVHTLVLSLDETIYTDYAVDLLRDQLDQQLEVFSWYQLADFYKNTVDLYRRQFGVLQVIILVMVLLSVASSVNMTLFERVGEFGTLKALGNRNGHIFKLVLVENVLLGMIGAVAGLAVGVTLSFVNAAFTDISHITSCVY